jgi:hypothetical protein
MSQSGQTRTSSLGAARPLPPSADIGPGGQSVGQPAQFCLAAVEKVAAIQFELDEFQRRRLLVQELG